MLEPIHAKKLKCRSIKRIKINAKQEVIFWLKKEELHALIDS